MRRADALLVLAFAAALVLGSIANRTRANPPLRVADGWLLAGDFHVHAFPGDGILSPVQLRKEAIRRNLDVIAITNHNQRLAARIAAPRSADHLPIVLYGEEVTTPAGHFVALSADRTVDWRARSADILDEIHARGGVAILAHPDSTVTKLGAGTLARFDGIEVANGKSFQAPLSEAVPLFESLRRQRPLAAIGSSDFHYAVPLGVQRTVLLAAELNERGVLAALVRGQTAVRFNDRWVGDSAVIELARDRTAELFNDVPRRSPLNLIAALVAWLALLGLVLRSGRTLV